MNHGGDGTSADDISSFSNRSPEMTTIFAPGKAIPAAYVEGKTASLQGTSMDSPVVTGDVVIMQEAAMDFLGRKLTYHEITKLLQDNGKSIFDGSQEYKRLNVEKVVAEIVKLTPSGFHNVEIKAGDTVTTDFGFVHNDDTINGITANEDSVTLVGTSANDSINGSSGNDYILAGDGNDFVKNNGGKDIINLGDGNDVAFIEGSESIITVGGGQDTLILAVDARDIEITDFEGPSKGASSVYKVKEVMLKSCQYYRSYRCNFSRRRR